MYPRTPFRVNGVLRNSVPKNVENKAQNKIPGYAHVRLTRQLRAQLRGLPDGQIDGLRHMVGEIKRLTLYAVGSNR